MLAFQLLIISTCGDRHFGVFGVEAKELQLEVDHQVVEDLENQVI